MKRTELVRGKELATEGVVQLGKHSTSKAALMLTSTQLRFSRANQASIEDSDGESLAMRWGAKAHRSGQARIDWHQRWWSYTQRWTGQNVIGRAGGCGDRGKRRREKQRTDRLAARRKKSR